jgi:hypothetical protein
MRKLRVALVVVVLLGVIGAALIIHREDCALDQQPAVLVRCIRNEDVKWDASRVGLLPQISGATAALLETKENIEPMLLVALQDKDKFVAAHVLLSLRSPSFPIGGHEAWNGLNVVLFADGRVSYEGNDLTALYKRWEQVSRQRGPDEK